MARLLFIVEQAMTMSDLWRRHRHIKNNSPVLLTPGIVVEPGERFRAGDRLVLKRPDGSILHGRIAGFSEVGYNRTRQGGWIWYDSAVAVADMEPEDIPVGTEVWSVGPPSRIP